MFGVPFQLSRAGEAGFGFSARRRSLPAAKLPFCRIAEQCRFARRFPGLAAREGGHDTGRKRRSGPTRDSRFSRIAGRNAGRGGRAVSSADVFSVRRAASGAALFPRFQFAVFNGLGRGIQNAVDKAHGIVFAELAREFQGFVDGDLCGDVLPVEHFIEG